MRPLTKPQQRVLRFIGTYTRLNEGVAPTLREIKERFGYTSFGTVHRHLQKLKEKGYLLAPKNAKRGLEVVRETCVNCGRDPRRKEPTT